MDASQPCYICGSSPSTSLPPSLVTRLVAIIQVDLGSVQTLTLLACSDCLVKLEKIEKMISELQDAFQKQEAGAASDISRSVVSPKTDDQNKKSEEQDGDANTADFTETSGTERAGTLDEEEDLASPPPRRPAIRNRSKTNCHTLSSHSRAAKTKAQSKIESIRTERKRKKLETSNKKLCESQARIYKCGCGITCGSKLEFTTHRKDQHVGKYVCQYVGCGRLFTKQFSLKQHEFVHYPGEHDCEVCGERMVSPLKLQVHMRRFHHATQTLSAHIDSLLPQGSVIGQINDTAKVSNDTLKDSPREGRASTCYKADVNDKDDLSLGTKDLEEISQVIPDMPCPICDHSYQVESLLKRHIEKFHWQKATDTLVCCFCKTEFTDLKDMLPHVREHRAEMQTCVECSEVFQNWSQIVKHRASVHGANAEQVQTPIHYNCDVCKAVLSTKSLLSYHNLLEHGKVTKLLIPRPRLKYLCKTCAMSFMTRKELEVHLQKHERRSKGLSDMSVFECNSCLKTFSDQNRRENHEAICTGELADGDVEKYMSEFPCAVCDGTYELKQQLDRHLRQAHWRADSNDISKHCVSCKMASTDIKEIVKHCRSHRKDMLPCRFCPDTAFFNAFQLSVHNSQLHSNNKVQTGVKKFSCPICNEEASTKSLLSYHAFLEHGEYLELTANTVKRLYQCPHCSKSFIQLLYMKRHILTNHEQNSQSGDKFNCPKCDKGYSAEVLLQAHLVQCSGKSEANQQQDTQDQGPKVEKTRLKRTSKRGGLCNLCGAKYNTKVMFDLHMMKHSGKWKLECKECEGKFLTESQLRAHMKRHTKPYLCTECGARFASTGNLKDHQVTHSTSEDWQCEVCKRSFRWRYSLFRHLNTAHNIGNKYKPAHFSVQCKLCGIQLMSGSMHRHIKRTHKMLYKRSYFSQINEPVTNSLASGEQLHLQSRVLGDLHAHRDLQETEIQVQGRKYLPDKVQGGGHKHRDTQVQHQVLVQSEVQLQNAVAVEGLGSDLAMQSSGRMDEQLVAERNMQLMLDSQNMQDVIGLQEQQEWNLDMYN